MPVSMAMLCAVLAASAAVSVDATFGCTYKYGFYGWGCYREWGKGRGGGPFGSHHVVHMHVRRTAGVPVCACRAGGTVTAP